MILHACFCGWPAVVKVLSSCLVKSPATFNLVRRGLQLAVVRSKVKGIGLDIGKSPSGDDLTIPFGIQMHLMSKQASKIYMSDVCSHRLPDPMDNEPPEFIRYFLYYSAVIVGVENLSYSTQWFLLPQIKRGDAKLGS